MLCAHARSCNLLLSHCCAFCIQQPSWGSNPDRVRANTHLLCQNTNLYHYIHPEMYKNQQRPYLFLLRPSEKDKHKIISHKTNVKQCVKLDNSCSYCEFPKLMTRFSNHDAWEWGHVSRFLGCLCTEKKELDNNVYSHRTLQRRLQHWALHLTHFFSWDYEC